MPKKLKHRKQGKGNIPKVSSRGYELNFGHFGLKALESGWVTARQIEAARRAATRCIKRGGQIWVRIFPDKPRTAQAAETGMGGGKGSLDHFVSVVSSGRIMFEMDGVPFEIAKEALMLAAHKMPIKSQFVSKE